MLNTNTLLGSFLLIGALSAQTSAQKSRDIILECRANKECAKVIAPRKPAELTIGDQLRAAALRTTILLTRAQSDGDLENALKTRLDAYCLAMDHLPNAATPQIVADVKITFMTAVPVDKCSPPPVGRSGGATVVANGIRGVFIMVGKLDTEGDSATVESVGDGVYWNCTFDRTELGWMPSKCTTTGK